MVNVGRVAGRICAATLTSGLVLGAAVAGAPLATAAPTPKYVGIVIQGSGSGCVKWHSGITGDEVLNAVARVKYRQDGLIVQIDGSPASAKADADHYWEYWRTTGGAWTYSASGASGTSPAAGSVEGWAFTTDGTKRSPSTSPSGLYRSLCGSKDTTTAPRPTRTSAAPVVPRHPRASRPTYGPGTPRRATTPAAGTATTVPSGPPSSASARPGTISSPSPSPSGSTPVGPSAVFSPTVPGEIGATPVSANSNDSGGSATPVVLGGVLALLLAAGAGFTVLRRRADADL